MKVTKSPPQYPVAKTFNYVICLKMPQRFYPKHFELEAITVDLGLGNFNMDAVKSLCNELNIPYTLYPQKSARLSSTNVTKRTPVRYVPKCARVR